MLKSCGESSRTGVVTESDSGFRSSPPPTLCIQPSISLLDPASVSYRAEGKNALSAMRKIEQRDLD